MTVVRQRGARTTARPPLFAALALVAAAIAVVAPRAGAQSAAAPGQRQVQPAQPAPPFRQLAPGLLARTRFVADSAGSPRVELWDLLVGPGRRSGPASLPGGAVLEVRGGSGRISVGGRQARELRPGATLAIPEGASFTIVNARTDLGLSIRATIITARRQ